MQIRPGQSLVEFVVRIAIPGGVGLVIVVIIASTGGGISLIIHATLREHVLQIRLNEGARVNGIEVIIAGRYVFWPVSGYCGYYIGFDDRWQRLPAVIEDKLLLGAFIS